MSVIMSTKNDILFKSIHLDIDEFEKGNDLTKEKFSQDHVQEGTFVISDGTEYGYILGMNLSIYKITEVKRS